MSESESRMPTTTLMSATLDTPGGRVDSLLHERDSFTMNRCKCLSSKDQSCLTDFSLGVSLSNVSLTRRWKVEERGRKGKMVKVKGGEKWWSTSSNPDFNGSTATSAPDLETSHISIPPLCHISNI